MYILQCQGGRNVKNLGGEWGQVDFPERINTLGVSYPNWHISTCLGLYLLTTYVLLQKRTRLAMSLASSGAMAIKMTLLSSRVNTQWVKFWSFLPDQLGSFFVRLSFRIIITFSTSQRRVKEKYKGKKLLVIQTKN